jgi:hypothetical protein
MSDGSDFGGDIRRRRFDGDVAQCGCRWRRDPDYGDVLVECPIHQAATAASVAAFDRAVARRTRRP